MIRKAAKIAQLKLHNITLHMCSQCFVSGSNFVSEIVHESKMPGERERDSRCHFIFSISLSYDFCIFLWVEIKAIV